MDQFESLRIFGQVNVSPKPYNTLNNSYLQSQAFVSIVPTTVYRLCDMKTAYQLIVARRDLVSNRISPIPILASCQQNQQFYKDLQNYLIESKNHGGVFYSSVAVAAQFLCTRDRRSIAQGCLLVESADTSLSKQGLRDSLSLLRRITGMGINASSMSTRLVHVSMLQEGHDKQLARKIDLTDYDDGSSPNICSGTEILVVDGIALISNKILEHLNKSQMSKQSRASDNAGKGHLKNRITEIHEFPVNEGMALVDRDPPVSYLENIGAAVRFLSSNAIVLASRGYDSVIDQCNPIINMIWSATCQVTSFIASPFQPMSLKDFEGGNVLLFDGTTQLSCKIFEILEKKARARGFTVVRNGEALLKSKSEYTAHASAACVVIIRDSIDDDIYLSQKIEKYRENSINVLLLTLEDSIGARDITSPFEMISGNDIIEDCVFGYCRTRISEGGTFKQVGRFDITV